MKLVGATPSEGKIAETGLLMYENGFGQGRHVVHRPHAEGVEDYVVFEQRPEVEELRYEVQVPEKAGLRLVSNVLEVVDEDGAPRLRMTAPAVVEATGAQVVPTVQVEGCAVDADTRLPWGRPVTAPGAEVCSVVAGWAAGAYPVVVDPAWTTTGSMATGREWHTATALASGKVLVAGGRGSGPLASSEVYDPVSNTWTSGSNMKTARERHTATALASGKVLVAGGRGSGYLASAEVYDPATGKWASGGTLTAARTRHTATLLPSGKVLVAGGRGPGGYLASTEVYDPATGKWTSGGTLATARYYHTAALLPSGKVLVAGGDDGNAYLASAEVWTPEVPGGTCSQDGECASGKCVDGVCCDTLCNGVCEACSQAKTGKADGTCAQVKADTDPDNECNSQGAGVCQTSGLCNGNGACADKSGTTCSATACLNTATQKNPSTCDATGNCVLPVPATTDCAPYACKGTACLTACTSTTDCAQGSACISGQCQGPKGNGKACGQADDCLSGFCVDGICCNNACDGDCQACTAAKTGGTTGTCGAVQCAGKFQCDANVCPSSCTTSDQCQPGNVCVASKCVLPSANGKACDPVNKGTDCASSFCVDGVCCDSPCKGQCEACDVSGKVGQCVPVPKGDVPHNVSPGGRQLCAGGNDAICHGVCDGASASTCVYPGSSIHCGDSCEQDSFVAALCDSAGGCAKQKPVSCALYACKDSACLTSCSDSTDCAAGSACIGGQCQSLKANGTTCGQANDCASGFCVDGVCCSDACDGACQACTAVKTGGTTGICGPVQCAGNFKCDANVCPSSCTTSDQCVNNTVCIDGICAAPKANGKACDPVNKGADCASSFCVDGVCCDSPCKGQCEACDVSDKVGQCIPIPKGDVPHNAGPGGRQLCAGGNDATCRGVCDGASASTCVYPGPATHCGDLCEQDSFVAGLCDSSGGCVKQKGMPCAPYTCDLDVKGCKTSCETSADCAAGNVCNAVTKTCGPATSTCVDATHVKGTSGQVETCPAGYTCSSATGTCNTKCSSSAECDTASGYKCEGSECKKDAGGAAGAAGSGDAGGSGGSTTAGTGGASTAGTGGGGGSTTAGDTPAEASEDDGGCGCEVPRSSRSTTWPGLTVAGLALASLRRRSRRR